MITAPLDDRYLSLAELATYAGLSQRTLMRWCARAVNPLPHVKIARRVRVKRSAFDAWVAHEGKPAEDPTIARAVAAFQRGRG